MRILADENIHAGIVAWLRANGEDIVHVADGPSAMTNEVLLARARDQKRILMTDDKDFGELILHQRLCTCGVILMRLGGASLSGRIARLQAVWPLVAAKQPGHFIVIGNQNIRVRPILNPH